MFFLAMPVSFLSKNIFITFVDQIKILHRLHSHICYEKAYEHIKFQKFNFKNLITMICPGFKQSNNEPKNFRDQKKKNLPYACKKV